MDYSYDFDDFDLTGYDGYTTQEGSDDYNLNFNEDSFFSGIFGGALIAFLMAYMVVIAIISLFMVITQWIVYKKANKPGWAVLIPIYSQWVLFEMVGMSGWYSLLALIPFVGGIVILVFYILALIKLAKCFGKEDGFAVGLILLPIVFFPILAFGKATFTPPVIEPAKN